MTLKRAPANPVVFHSRWKRLFIGSNALQFTIYFCRPCADFKQQDVACKLLLNDYQFMLKTLFLENNTCVGLKNLWGNSVSENDALVSDGVI